MLMRIPYRPAINMRLSPAVSLGAGIGLSPICKTESRDWTRYTGEVSEQPTFIAPPYVFSETEVSLGETAPRPYSRLHASLVNV